MRLQARKRKTHSAIQADLFFLVLFRGKRLAEGGNQDSLTLFNLFVSERSRC
jgi:hypothetical protein